MFYRNAQVFFLPSKCPFCQKIRRNGDNKCKEGNCGNMARPYGSDSEGEDDITMSYDSDG